MNELNFSYNWNNKLDCKCFSTLRLSNRFNVGDNVTIKLNDKFHSFGQVVFKKRFLRSQINDAIAYLDTGYDSKECIKILDRMYKNKGVNWNEQHVSWYLIKKNDKKKPMRSGYKTPEGAFIN